MIVFAGVLTVAACSSDSGTSPSGTSGVGPASGTSCTLTGCTVVLYQGVDARTSVLGIPVELVSITGNQARLKVAGQQVDIPLNPNTAANIGGLAVSVQSINKDKVVLKVTRP
jgi:hypothetical protein